jgi:FkbM family methyltransferase
VDVGEASAEYELANLQSYGVIRSTVEEERAIVRRLLSELDEDDTFWDVGANIGVCTCLAGEVATDGDVVAFEPYAPNTEVLAENAALNDVDVELRAEALADTVGETTFFVMYTSEEGTQEGSIDPEYAEPGETVRELTVPQVPGDELVRTDEVAAPDVVKMDIEGAAPQAISGMSDTLRSTVRLLVVEPHANFEELTDQLAGLGFDLEYVNRGVDPEPTIFAYDREPDPAREIE